MLLDRDSYMYQMIRCELLDAVGPQNVDTGYSDAAGHSIDYYWIPEMWHDRGMKMSLPDFVVYPGSAEEVSKVLKIANQYKIPVTPWGGGAGSQGGALPVYNGIILDTKRRYDCFQATDLELVLKARGVTMVMFTGINTNSCVLATTVRANTLDFAPVVVEDCVDTMDGPELHTAGLQVIKTAFGWVMTAEEIQRDIFSVLSSGQYAGAAP